MARAPTEKERALLEIKAIDKLGSIPPPYFPHETCPAGIKALPKDMVLEVFRHLELHELLSSRLVCKTWNHFAFLAPVSLPVRKQEKFQILCLLFPSAHRIVVPKSGTILDETSIARIEQMKCSPVIDLSLIMENSKLLLDPWISLLRSRVQWHIAKDNYPLVVKYATLLIACNKGHEHKDFYNRGNAFLEMRKFAEAQADYQQIILLRPSIPDGYRAMGGLYSAKSDYPSALKWLARALEVSPDDFDVLDYRARFHQKFGFHQNAIADYDKMLQLRPRIQRIIYARATALSDLGRYEEAIAEFSRAINLQSDHQQCGPIYFRRGKAYAKLGKKKEAAEDFQKSLETKAILGRDWNAHGQIHALQGKHEEALVCFDKALTLLPDIPEYLIARARSLLAIHKYAEAVLDLSHASELIPHDKEIQRERDEAIAIRNKHLPQMY